MGNKDKWTGERLETFVTTEAMTEHLHRYAIIFNLIKNKKVLDIACGEGYGTALMSKYAKHVTGIDIDKDTISKASHKYRSENINFIDGSILNIPVNDSSYDIITCFETIEHISNHDKALNELKRILSSNGILVISTPEKKYYSDLNNFKNPFHQKELYEKDFIQLLNKYFTYYEIYSQSSFNGSLIMKDGERKIIKYYSGDYNQILEIPEFSPFFKIALASDNNIEFELPSGIFLHPKRVSELIFEEGKSLRSTITYRIGNMFLYPFKLVKKIFDR